MGTGWFWEPQPRPCRMGGLSFPPHKDSTSRGTTQRPPTMGRCGAGTCRTPRPPHRGAGMNPERRGGREATPGQHQSADTTPGWGSDTGHTHPAPLGPTSGCAGPTGNEPGRGSQLPIRTRGTSPDPLRPAAMLRCSSCPRHLPHLPVLLFLPVPVSPRFPPPAAPPSLRFLHRSGTDGHVVSARPTGEEAEKRP